MHVFHEEGDPKRKQTAVILHLTIKQAGQESHKRRTSWRTLRRVFDEKLCVY